MNLDSLATRLAIACLAGCLLGAASSADAQDNFFVPPGGVGNWNDSANWTLGHLPTSGETVYVHAGREATVDSFISDSPQTVRLADFDTGADVDGTLNILNGADLLVTGQLIVAPGGSGAIHGVLNQSGGSLDVQDALFIAFDPNDTAEFNLSGGDVTVGNLWFRFGDGLLTQTGGTMTAAQLVLAEGGDVGTASLYDLKSGVFNVTGDANIGKAPGGGDPFANSHGSMNISGGVATFGGLLFGNDATDVIRLSGTGVLNVDQQFYAPSDAQFDIANGNIQGTGLMVNTVMIGGLAYTQITVPAPAGVPGDYNGNGIVDAADYVVWRAHLGQTYALLNRDSNNGGAINQNDYTFWKSNFGAHNGSGALSSATVPEPGSLILMTIGTILVVTRRRVSRA